MRQCAVKSAKEIRPASRGLVLLLAFLLVSLSAGGAWAAMGEISSFTLLEDKNTDIVGKATSMGADGLMDAGFSLNIRGNGAITRITLLNTTNGKRWDTSAASGFSMLGVRSDKGETLNSGSEMALFAFVFGVRLSVWVNDRETTLAKDGTYEATVYFVDQSTAKATTTVKGIAAPAVVSPAATESKEASIVSAILQGQKNEDFVTASTTNKKIGKSGHNDWVTEVKLNAVGTITGFRLRNTSGPAGAWDTFPDSKNPLIAVLSDGSLTLPKIFNKDDGNVSIPISGDMTFYLLVEDNGSLEDSDTKTLLTVQMGNKIVEKTITRNLPETGGSFDIVSFEYNGRGKYDFVSESPKLTSNLVPDIGLSCTLNAKGTINGLRIVGTWDDSNGKKVTKTWDTIPTSSAFAVAVTRQDGKRLNKDDATISIPIKSKETFYFWIDSNEEVGKNPSFRADIAFSDGRILTASWTQAPEVTGKTTTQTEARSIRMTAKPAPLKTGVVGKTEVPVSGAKNNMSLLVRVRGTGTIARMSLVSQSATGSWDTTPDNKIPLLGVREKSKLLNAKDGTIKIPVKNSIDLELIVEDNGSVKKGNARFLLSIAWSDGEITKEILAW